MRVSVFLLLEDREYFTSYCYIMFMLFVVNMLVWDNRYLLRRCTWMDLYIRLVHIETTRSSWFEQKVPFLAVRLIGLPTRAIVRVHPKSRGCSWVTLVVARYTDRKYSWCSALNPYSTIPSAT